MGNMNTPTLPDGSMYTGTICPAALKEWAVAIQALGKGHQTLIIRKGGIREFGNRFHILYPEFLLSPSYEHQQAQLLRPEYARAGSDALAEIPEADWLTFTHFARVHKAFCISELAQLQGLAPYHIWSAEYAEKRLRWRPRQPLTVMILRVYCLDQPIQVTMTPRYIGCKSWLELESPVPLGSMQSALSDQEFFAQANAIDQAMATVIRPIEASP